MDFVIDEPLVKRLIETVDAGLCHGVGAPRPGEMCVEAAVCFAMGLPHGDEPTCVDGAVRAFKIALNDSSWSSNAARAKGLRRIAVAQLGSKGKVDPVKFCTMLAEKTIRVIVPIALMAAAKLCATFADKLEEAAIRCEVEGTAYAANAAASYASAAASAARAASAASDASDSILSKMADIAVDVLIACGSPGCDWLHLLD